jgi:hypothetical protein
MSLVGGERVRHPLDPNPAFGGFLEMTKMMKAAAIIVCAGLAMATSAHAYFYTAGEMLSYCAAVENAQTVPGPGGENVSFVPSFASGICWGYFGALMDVVRVREYNNHDQPVLYYCPSPEVRVGQYVKVFTLWARSHPEQLHMDALSVAKSALMHAFPCPVAGAKQ